MFFIMHKFKLKSVLIHRPFASYVEALSGLYYLKLYSDKSEIKAQRPLVIGTGVLSEQNV